MLDAKYNPPFVLLNKNGIIPKVEPNDITNKLTFTTQQFMQLLFEDENIYILVAYSMYHVGDPTPNDLRVYFLNEKMIKAIDERRKDLTIENIENLSGHIMGMVNNGHMTIQEAVDQYKVNDINYSFIEYMNKYLYNNSILTIPSEMVLESKPWEIWPDDRFDWSHQHYIVGATKEGHIIGWACDIVWT